MRLRFSIRDLLWLTLLAAVLTAWWLDHRRLTAQIIEPFSTNLSLILGGGQQVHEKIEDLSPEEFVELQEEIEREKDEEAAAPSVQSNSKQSGEGGFGGNGGFGGGGF